MLKPVLIFIASMFFVGSALAEPVAVTASEIKTLLSGNSIEGNWSGEEYKQYFDASGSTVYLPRGSRPSNGKWRVDAQSNKYESWWERGGWSGYGVIREGDDLFWTSTGLEPQPFKVVPGRQMVWEN